MTDDQLLSQLTSKYGGVISAAPELGIQLQNVHVENGKLLIRGTAPNDDAKNDIWNRIKAVDSSYPDLVADITIDARPAQHATHNDDSKSLDLSGILDRYADQADIDGNDHDFDQIVQHAPPGAMAQGLAEAFRSDRTPPFPNMLGTMFGQSDPNARAGILNQLLATAGPAILAKLFGGGMSGGSGTSAGSGLAGVLGELFGQGGPPQVTPEQASQIPAEAVAELAREAQRDDPNIISRVSDFAAQHPTLVKGLGAVAVGIALKHLAGQKRGGFF